MRRWVVAGSTLLLILIVSAAAPVDVEIVPIVGDSVDYVPEIM